MACKDQDICLEMILKTDTGAPESFVDKFLDFRVQQNERHKGVNEKADTDQEISAFSFVNINTKDKNYKLLDQSLAMMIATPGVKLDDKKIEQLHKLGYEVTLALKTRYYCIPAEFDETGNLKARTNLDGEAPWPIRIRH